MNILSPTYRSPDPVSGFDGPEIPDPDAVPFTKENIASYIAWLDKVERVLAERPTPPVPRNPDLCINGKRTSPVPNA